MTKTMNITPAIQAAADNMEACAEFSKANPNTPLRDNPHAGREANRLHRAATGSINTLWVCPQPCGQVMPRVIRDDEFTGELMTACCGSTVVELY